MHGIRDMQQQAAQLNRINCIYHLYIEKSICTEIISSSAPMKPDAVEPDSLSHFLYFICKSHKSSLRLLTSHRLLPLCFSVPPATCDAGCLALDPHTYTVFCEFEAHKAHQNASIWRCSCMSGVDEVNRKRPALQRDRMEWKWKLMSERGRERRSAADWKCSASNSVGPEGDGQRIMKYIVHQKSKIDLKGKPWRSVISHWVTQCSRK